MGEYREWGFYQGNDGERERKGVRKMCEKGGPEDKRTVE
jgi:hypothetical protein